MVLGTAFAILALLARSAFPMTIAPTDYNGDYYDYSDYGDPCDYIDEREIRRAYEGEAVELRCPLADCITPSSPISWFKDGKAFPWTDQSAETIQMKGDLNETLEIYPVQIAQDNGTYRCEGFNGTERLVGQISLHVKLAPTKQSPVILHPTTNGMHKEYRRLGQNVTFSCHAYFGVQQIIKQVYWLVDGHFIDDTDRIKEGYTTREDEKGKEFVNGTLIITDIKPEDYSQYTCVAKNLFGNETAQVQLVEGDDPRSESAVKEDLNEEMQQYKNGAAGGGAVLMMVCVLALVYYWKKLEIRLMIKDKFMPFEEGDTIEHTSEGDEDFQFHEQELHVTHFTMDVKLQQNARVLLSQEKGPKGVTYEIIIGSDNNTRSAIRRHVYGMLTDQREVSSSTPQILSGNEWKTFWVSFKDGIIEVGTPGEDPFLKWVQGEHLNVKYLGFMNGSRAKGKLRFSDLGQKEYDVFILYDIQQIGFVKNLLLPFLEKTCRCVVRIEHRDFDGGTDTFENYVEFIQRSRRVLFVLSPNYVKNQWMKFASCVALDEMLREKARIVMIEYLPIKDQEDFETLKIFNEQVQKLMKAVTCIKWSDQAETRTDHRFWRELRYNMPKKRVLTRKSSAWELLRQRSVQADSVVSNSVVRFGFRRQRSTLSDGVADYSRESKERSTLSDDSAIIAEDDREEATTPCLRFIDETCVCNDRSSMLEKETVL
ncbi:interleukin-1 receptor accessory protein-like 1-B [Branchiostoma lanceolatum]|uniref:interleukin-1 receptor accessory protein-like 1-B n=1 Tax=Branchiostoma lanceolatum TaxID=7740 RepID=UPI00345565B7